jgi:hypothetical protein
MKIIETEIESFLMSFYSQTNELHLFYFNHVELLNGHLDVITCLFLLIKYIFCKERKENDECF